MNSNTFQDNPSTTRDGAISYKFGSLATPTPCASRHRAQPLRASISAFSSARRALTVWLARRHEPPRAGELPRPVRTGARRSAQIYAHAARRLAQMFTEHKPYEPAFYSSVNNDWGSSLLLAQGTGRARLLSRRSRPSPAEHQHRAGRVAARDGRSARWFPLQRLEVRRRRPHGRLDHAVPALPHRPRTARRRRRTHAGPGVHDRPEQQPEGSARRPHASDATPCRSRSRRRCASIARSSPKPSSATTP